MQKIVNSLKNLKKYNAVAVKQSLEDEGVSRRSYINETDYYKAKLIWMLKLWWKQNDIHFVLKVKGIVAPMNPICFKKILQSISNNNKQKLYKFKYTYSKI